MKTACHYIPFAHWKIICFFVFAGNTIANSQITITGYNHVALAVKDMEVSVAFYRDIIGLKPIEVPENLKTIRSWFVIAPGQELHLLAGRVDTVANDKNGSHFLN